MKTDNLLLKGKTVITTHPAKERDELVDVLKQYGIRVLQMPLIETVPCSFSLPKPLSFYDWVVFTSKNALQPFFAKQSHCAAQIAVIGNSTSHALTALGWKADFVGSGKSGGHFSRELRQVLHPNDKVLLVLGKLAPAVLTNNLTKFCQVERINVYDTKMPSVIDESVLELIKSDAYDLITVTSPSAVHHLIQLLGEAPKEMRLVSIGEITSAAIRRYGIEPVATASTQTYREVACSVLNCF
ncbi:uroporphyrinogen-III synthase [Geofilum sp. OHC36d9]|uniref:uroporphyrinogen-III synthase n=1 Tax=Geofilum sp. OHC36d9 TaxID=3458413 RepID=UPI004034D992